MPFTTNWTEELVAEWLQLENYLVETRLPSVSATVGGRYEPDIVGAKVENGDLKIRHCEVTSFLSGNPIDTANSYDKKFSTGVCDWVIEHFMEPFGRAKGQPCTYEKWVVAGGFSKNMEIELLKKVPGVQLKQTDTFIRDTVLPAIRKWTTHAKTPKGTSPTLPQGLWLLQFLDYMDWSLLVYGSKYWDEQQVKKHGIP